MIEGLGGELLGKTKLLSSSSWLDFRRCIDVPLTAIVSVFNMVPRHEEYDRVPEARPYLEVMKLASPKAAQLKTNSGNPHRK